MRVGVKGEGAKLFIKSFAPSPLKIQNHILLTTPPIGVEFIKAVMTLLTSLFVSVVKMKCRFLIFARNKSSRLSDIEVGILL